MHHDAPIYAARRRRMLDAMGSDAVAVFLSGHERNRSHDTDYPFRASSDVLYLTGFEEPDAVTVLAPGHEDGPLVMFVRPRDKEKEIWNGRRAGIEGARDRYGADTAYNLEELDEKLPALLEGAETLFYALGADTAFDVRITGYLRSLRHRRGKPPAAPGVLRDPRDLLYPMRLVKTDDELAVLRRACEISAEAHIAAMRACRPGMHEFELQALIEYVFKKNGAAAPAYTTIVGAGENATILHYTENCSRIEEGDVVLIDAGCEFQHYAGDITRSFPATGRFTPAQRDLYQAVLDAQVKAVELCTVGRTWKEIHEATVENLTRNLVDLNLLSGSVDALIEDEAYKRFFMHKTGHWLGIDVHDVGPYYADGDEPSKLVPGVVQTIEPGLYIEAGAEDIPREFWGLGVRIEDDVLTTEDGPVVLTASCPKTVEELEELVGTGYTLEV